MDTNPLAGLTVLVARIEALIAAVRATALTNPPASLPQRSAKQEYKWYKTRTVGTVAAMILPANPRRWSVSFCVTQSGTGYALANAMPTNLNDPAFVFDDAAVSQFLMLEYARHGTIVGQEWWGYGLSAGGTVQAVELVLQD